MGDNVTYERREDVAVITIERQESRNAIDYETGRELLSAFKRLDDDDKVGAGVVTGSGDVFCAGGDLDEISEMGSMEGREDGFMGFSHAEVEKPLIAAIEGYAVGGGLELSLFCDIRIAGEGAIFGCFERRWGVPLLDGGTQRLPHVVGLGRALEMIFTGREVHAQEAYDWGLANQTVPDGETLETAIQMGNAIASFPLPSITADKKSVYKGLGKPLDDGLAIESWSGSHALPSAREGAGEFSSGKGRGGVGTYEDVLED